MNSTSDARAQETLTADAVKRYLIENQIPVLIENGGMFPLSSLRRMRES